MNIIGCEDEYLTWKNVVHILPEVEIIRSFLAVELSPRNKSIILDFEKKLQSMLGQPMNWVKPENCHLTLKFLGSHPLPLLDPLVRRLSALFSTTKPFDLTFSHLGSFPNMTHPRNLWIGVTDNPGLLDLIEQIEPCSEKCGFTREERAPHPHVTIARISNKSRDLDIMAIGKVISQATSPVLESQRITSMVLLKSELRPSGPVYTRVSVIPFAGE